MAHLDFRTHVLVELDRCREANIGVLAVHRPVDDVEVQGHLIDGHAEHVLEEDDSRLTPSYVGEITLARLDELVDQTIGHLFDLLTERRHARRQKYGFSTFRSFCWRGGSITMTASAINGDASFPTLISFEKLCQSRSTWYDSSYRVDTQAPSGGLERNGWSVWTNGRVRA